MLMIYLFSLIGAVNHIYFEKLSCGVAAMCGHFFQVNVRQKGLVVGLKSV